MIVVVVVVVVAWLSLEWSIPDYIVSFDLRKVFDRVEHRSFFEALRSQGVKLEETWS